MQRSRPAARRLALLVFGVLLAGFLPSAGAQGPPERYVVVLKDTVRDPGAVAAEHARTQGAQVSFVYRSAFKGYAAAIPSNRLASLKADRRVEFVSPDLEVHALGQTLPTGVDRIDAEPGSPTTNLATSGVAVAIIDTGSGPHADLNIAGGKNCSTGKSFNDGNGHGTHVAGTVAAWNNEAGVVGVAPGAPIYSVRVLNNAGSGTWSSVACGIDWVTANAVSKNIKVANMSLGGSGSDDGNCGSSNKDALHKAICGSVAAGVTYVVAAGNDGGDFKGLVPATYDEVLTVSAMSDFNGASGGGATPTCLSETDDSAASFSNFATLSSDQAHTIAAPGICILSTWKDGGYNIISGTSMATPHVSGAAARCIGSGPCAGLTARQVIAQLRADAAAQPTTYGFTGDPGHSSVPGKYYGYLVHPPAF